MRCDAMFCLYGFDELLLLKSKQILTGTEIDFTAGCGTPFVDLLLVRIFFVALLLDLSVIALADPPFAGPFPFILVSEV